MNTIEEELEVVWSEFESGAQIIAKQVGPNISALEVMQFIKLSVQKAYLAGQLSATKSRNDELSKTTELIEDMLGTMKTIANSSFGMKKEPNDCGCGPSCTNNLCGTD
jgi:hypothetical protein